MSPEIFALLAPLPAKVKAVTVTDDNLTFTIVISEDLCTEPRTKPHLREPFDRSSHPDRARRTAGRLNKKTPRTG